ncbi:uncharacterized protein TrAFT101_008147 [Trichoderma asperellum]|uniref:uncharacterized protein n=1 Tax=Trichoderma asperellum TaxID=101201 RepID=UPI00332D02BF|nr:hypothetical protein TrAFT101_008147 [Trichoderma asperellum]
MIYWESFAYVTGPNYNQTWPMFDPNDLARIIPKYRNIAQIDLGKVDHIFLVEKVLIEAVEKRYSSNNISNDYR